MKVIQFHFHYISIGTFGDLTLALLPTHRPIWSEPTQWLRILLLLMPTTCPGPGSPPSLYLRKNACTSNPQPLIWFCLVQAIGMANVIWPLKASVEHCRRRSILTMLQLIFQFLYSNVRCCSLGYLQLRQKMRQLSINLRRNTEPSSPSAWVLYCPLSIHMLQTNRSHHTNLLPAFQQ